ncbi:MAG TPA: hypothetical protein VMV58_04040 [Desulfosporosinus sp.]|nr:hypothetical protein [Desulfosporosinus sp.]
MGFLKRKFSKDNTAENIDTLTEQCETVSSISQPPETLYENEAWAPEIEFVGLFRKRRINAEEKTSPSSNRQ